MDIPSIAGTLARLGAPILGGLLGGPVGAAAMGVVASAFNVEATPDAISAAIKADPEKASAVLAIVEANHAAAFSELQALLTDRQNARATTVELAQAGSSIAWGAPIVSAVVMLTFAAVMVRVILHGIPTGSEAIMIGLIETLKTLTIAVVSYWVGSSSGSRGKDATIASMSQSAGGQIVDAATTAVKAIVKGRR